MKRKKIIQNPFISSAGSDLKCLYKSYPLLLQPTYLRCQVLRLKGSFNTHFCWKFSVKCEFFEKYGFVIIESLPRNISDLLNSGLLSSLAWFHLALLQKGGTIIFFLVRTNLQCCICSERFPKNNSSPKRRKI